MSTNHLVLIVTGVSAGIGRGITLEAIKNGAKVIGVSRRNEKLEALKNEVLQQGYPEDSFDYIAGDATDKSVAEAVIEKAIKRHGRINVLVNNVGGAPLSNLIANQDLNDFISIYHLNIFSTYIWTQTALPYLRKVNGIVINISSMASVKQIDRISAYCSSKAALNSFTACLACEEKEIQTIAICPGLVFSEALEKIYDLKDSDVSFVKTLRKYTREEARERLFSPEDSGHYVWRLITNFPSDFNGKFVSSDEPLLSSYHRRKVVGIDLSAC